MGQGPTEEDGVRTLLYIQGDQAVEEYFEDNGSQVSQGRQLQIRRGKLKGTLENELHVCVCLLYVFSERSQEQ